jgi:hypothetical protein
MARGPGIGYDLRRVAGLFLGCGVGAFEFLVYLFPSAVTFSSLGSTLMHISRKFVMFDCTVPPTRMDF